MAPDVGAIVLGRGGLPSTRCRDPIFSLLLRGLRPRSSFLPSPMKRTPVPGKKMPHGNWMDARALNRAHSSRNMHKVERYMSLVIRYL